MAPTQLSRQYLDNLFPVFRPLFLQNILADTATDLPVDPHGQAHVPLSFAELLRNRRDLVVRHPDLNRNHPRLKL